VSCALVGICIGACVGLGVTGCQQVAPAPAAAVAAPTDWDACVDAFFEARFKLRPDPAIWAGRHDFDGRLPDWSPEGIRRLVARLDAERTRAAAFADAALDTRQRFERDHLLSRLDRGPVLARRRGMAHPQPDVYAMALGPDVYVFHDEFLRYGAPPIPLVRKAMMGGDGGSPFPQKKSPPAFAGGPCQVLK
jgi:hypothetical protein